MEEYIPKVGDIVIIVKGERNWNLDGKMDQWIGTSQIIRELHYDFKGLYIKFVNSEETDIDIRSDDNINEWFWRSEHIRPYIKKILKLKFR